MLTLRKRKMQYCSDPQCQCRKMLRNLALLALPESQGSTADGNSP
jgi:hypothetical protein